MGDGLFPSTACSVVTHFPHPPLSQSVFAEFCEPKWSFFIHTSGKLDLRSPVQFSQTPKIRIVTVQGAECGLLDCPWEVLRLLSKNVLAAYRVPFTNRARENRDFRK